MLVEMKDICKDYPQGKETVRILKNINLQVEEGDYLAIMGLFIFIGHYLMKAALWLQVTVHSSARTS